MRLFLFALLAGCAPTDEDDRELSPLPEDRPTSQVVTFTTDAYGDGAAAALSLQIGGTGDATRFPIDASMELAGDEPLPVMFGALDSRVEATAPLWLDTEVDQSQCDGAWSSWLEGDGCSQTHVVEVRTDEPTELTLTVDVAGRSGEAWVVLEVIDEF